MNEKQNARFSVSPPFRGENAVPEFRSCLYSFSFLGIARTSSVLRSAIGNPVDLLIDFIIRIRYETL